MLRHLILFSFFIFNFSFLITAQSDASHIKISLLTCTPGEELYSTFGHSALRVTDSINHDDIVYNYGTFNFDEPGFYTKFVRGKLTFYLSPEDFDSFLYSYQQENRGITEQVLKLTNSEKFNIIRLLQVNMMPANRFYKYDFTFDNCTTRLRDIVEKTADTTIHFGNILQSKQTFRDLIYVYLNRNDKQWSKLGIDLLLGSKMDVIMSTRQVMFLPDYLMKTFDNTKIGNTPLVASSNVILPFILQQKSNDFFTNPLFVFSFLFVLIAFLSFSKNNSTQRILHGFDGFLFFVTGLLGILILIMWFGTDHVMCRDNYNLIWALPTNVVAAFYINSEKKIARTYFKIAAFITSVILLLWFVLPQHMNTSLLPFIMLLIFRYVINFYGQINSSKLNGK